MPDLSMWRKVHPLTPESGPADVVAVLGSSGFVGRAVVSELRSRGIGVRPIRTPRLQWPHGQSLETVSVPRYVHREVTEDLASRLEGVQVVINAAGLPDGCAPASLALYGANALLPTIVARSCALAGVERFVHASSAAVQGTMALDETSRTAEFSPYSRSKALGERLLLREDMVETTIYRATWVHDVDRPNTRGLIRLAQSPVSFVAGNGCAPTPQVLIDDVADAIAHLALAPGPVPPIVLQPPNGMTTGLLLRLLGGREPRRVPRLAAGAGTRCLTVYGRISRGANAHVRRIEMVLFGKEQVPGWLADQGLAPKLRPEAWERLAARIPGRSQQSQAASLPDVNGVRLHPRCSTDSEIRH
ncbi:NAD(P)-dependent oxidoreductase [Micromonospora sp. C95]|uniref:NAD-dependent epimerase/dehydratase family protein n=1 Tax=Micromonospora sp. C95 TaxID=2824882 RepID=UPI001B363F8A|nr:NAD(P)-dependent oxidoreductase [Micromonospora sp. C95]MBQ1024161.1 NAD(P)-dependent oxidoreductase [Micromonospora sp. C95]